MWDQIYYILLIFLDGVWVFCLVCVCVWILGNGCIKESGVLKGLDGNYVRLLKIKSIFLIIKNT